LKAVQLVAHRPLRIEKTLYSPTPRQRQVSEVGVSGKLRQFLQWDATCYKSAHATLRKTLRVCLHHAKGERSHLCWENARCTLGGTLRNTLAPLLECCLTALRVSTSRGTSLTQCLPNAVARELQHQMPSRSGSPYGAPPHLTVIGNACRLAVGKPFS
jgi:hypothetical protein